MVADVTVPDDVERAVAAALQAFGRIDVVHNNVGATRLGGPEELTLDEWRATFAVNLDSVFLGVQKTLPHLLDRGGSIINVSSTASIRWTGYPYPAYAAAKAAVNQLTRALALQYADRGVRVNAILAGLIDTPLVYRELSGGRPSRRRPRRARGALPHRRDGQRPRHRERGAVPRLRRVGLRHGHAAARGRRPARPGRLITTKEQP